jgi:hypothetical protein
MDNVYYDINDPNKQGTPTNMEFAENIPAETPVEPLINSMGSNVAISTILPTNSFNVTYPYTLLSENEIAHYREMVEDNNEEHLI